LLLSHFSPDDTRLAELLLVVLDEDHVALALFLLTSHLSHDDVRPGLLPVLLPAGVRWPDRLTTILTTTLGWPVSRPCARPVRIYLG
jgi:hypothetical protein